MATFNPLATIYSPQGQTVTYNSLAAAPQLSSALTSSAPTPTVFLSRLTPTTNETQLLALGSPYGHVKSARFVQRAQEGKSFGFIMFGSVAEAQNCILGLMDQGYKVGFARETLKEKLERLADPFETNVYVKNLPAAYSTQALERLFAPSIIVSSKILESGNGGVLGKGVALVRLQTRDEAHSAVDALHGRLLPGSQGNLVVRFADSPAQKVVREEAARIKRKDLDSPSSSPTGSWTSSMPGGSLPESWATPMSSPQTPNSPFLGGYQQAFNPLGLPYPNLPFFQPSAQASYLLQAHQQRAFNGFGGGGGGGQNFASFPSSAATSATSSTFGPPVGLGLTYPANSKLATAGGGGVDDESWSRIHW